MSHDQTDYVISSVLKRSISVIIYSVREIGFDPSTCTEGAKPPISDPLAVSTESIDFKTQTESNAMKVDSDGVHRDVMRMDIDSDVVAEKNDDDKHEQRGHKRTMTPIQFAKSTVKEMNADLFASQSTPVHVNSVRGFCKFERFFCRDSLIRAEKCGE